MDTTSIIHIDNPSCLSTRDCSIWWSLCDGMGRGQLACYGTPDTSRDDSDRHFHWPPKSPDMSIIDDIRDALLHAVEKRSPPPRTPLDLLTALKDERCELPPRFLQTPVESMPHRFASFLRARGSLARY
ncbi:hypothetical protein AVEN_274793-1 [Araneus ventricosus]|uniref:Uncharacterized protein n=1 Tax=Araneus ventricosus TaxID=182803 RepID=A0A4Y2N193_ARAVE|nr:hypothetical protein AVEN_274793-1 [Araneus ventricosus]